LGLINALRDRNLSIGQCVTRVDDLDIEFLAAPATSQAQPSSADMLGSARMAELLAAAKAEYNYIVVDLPPTAPIADARAITPHLSNILLIVAWGKTSIDDVAELLAQAPSVRRKCAGLILNMVDLDRLNLYSNSPSRDYANLYY
jgi:succinoglycan biosynthesis transport protein ExoP